MTSMHDQCQQQLNGFYRGVVLKHLSNGKCKIWIPGVYPAEWNSYSNADLIPSAEQASSIAFGTNDGNGIFSYPNIGSIVWCFFERGDQNFPVYFASTLGGIEAKKKWNDSLAMVNNHPFDAFVHQVEVGNTHITLNETGFVKIVTHSIDKNKDDTCTFTMDSSGNISIESGNTITVKAKNIVIDGSTQIDVRAPNIKEIANTHLNVQSKAIELDSSLGHTTIKSRALYSFKNPSVVTF